MGVQRGKGTRYWYYDFQIRGRRYTGPTGQTDKTAARRVERAERTKIEAGLGPDEASDMTLDMASARWFDEVGQHLQSAIDYQRALDVLADCLPGKTLLREIDGPKVREAMLKRRAMLAEFKSKAGVRTRQVKNSTINRQVFEMLRRIHRHARITWGAKNLPEINWKELRFNEGKKREREISDEEREKLDSVRQLPHWREFRVFLGTYGVRLGEMFFHPDSVFEVNGEVSIRIRERKDGSTYTIDLDEEDGRLMLARKSRAQAAGLETVWFWEERRNDELVLVPCKYETARRALRRLIKRTGISDLTIHDHRHDVATKVTREEGIAVAQAQLGHADISTTRRYVKVARKDRLRGVAVMKSQGKSRDASDKSENPVTNQKDAL